MSAATNEMVVQWKGVAGHSVSAGTLKAGTVVFKGVMAMMIAGVVYNAGDPTSLLTAIAGADANGGLKVWARQSNVRLQIAGGTSKALGVTVTFANAGYIDVVLQQATDGGGLTTSTAAAAAEALRAHGLARRLIRVAYTGTGAGLTATTAATAVPVLRLLGWSSKTYGDAASVADQAIEMEFKTGIALAAAAADAPTRAQLGSKVRVADNLTVGSVLGPLDPAACLIDVDAQGNPWIKVG